MSGKSCTSGSMRSCGGSVRLGTSSGHEVVLDALYERKRDNKSVRVLTVLVYVFCVSLAAIMLSLYYVFFWEPKDAQHAQRKVSQTVKQQTSTTPLPTCFMLHTGGSSTAMNVTDVQLPPSTTAYPDVHEPSEVIDTSVIDPTHPNSTLPYNVTTDADAETVSSVTTATTVNDKKTRNI